MAVAIAGVFPFTKKLEHFPIWESVFLCAVFMLSVLEVVGSSYNPFIYFNF
jgi:hypothetical protein